MEKAQLQEALANLGFSRIGKFWYYAGAIRLYKVREDSIFSPYWIFKIRVLHPVGLIMLIIGFVFISITDGVPHAYGEYAKKYFCLI